MCKCKYTICPSQEKGRDRYRCGTRMGRRYHSNHCVFPSYVFIKHEYPGVGRIK